MKKKLIAILSVALLMMIVSTQSVSAKEATERTIIRSDQIVIGIPVELGDYHNGHTSLLSNIKPVLTVSTYISIYSESGYASIALDIDGDGDSDWRLSRLYMGQSHYDIIHNAMRAGNRVKITYCLITYPVWRNQLIDVQVCNIFTE